MVEVCGGCSDPEMLEAWFKRIPDHHFQIARPVNFLLSVVKRYREEVSDVWVKSSYDWSSHEKIPGTTQFLEEYFEKNFNTFVPDERLGEAVERFVKELSGESDFNKEIKAAWEAQYIQMWEIYKVFFALKMYEDSLTEGQWENQKAGYVVGEKITLREVEVVSKEEGADEYGPWTYIVFKNKEGVLFSKSFSSTATLESNCKNPDGSYSFIAKCGYINDRKRMIKLEGRISRIK